MTLSLRGHYKSGNSAYRNEWVRSEYNAYLLERIEQGGKASWSKNSLCTRCAFAHSGHLQDLQIYILLISYDLILPVAWALSTVVVTLFCVWEIKRITPCVCFRLLFSATEGNAHARSRNKSAFWGLIVPSFTNETSCSRVGRLHNVWDSESIQT